MSQQKACTFCAIAALMILGHATRVDAQPYEIGPGGTYTFLPSPEGTGLPGCATSDFECAFGLEGTFRLSVDAGSRNARLVDVDLTLIGNEAVQQTEMRPMVTSVGVAEWLEEREFVDLGSPAPSRCMRIRRFQI